VKLLLKPKHPHLTPEQQKAWGGGCVLLRITVATPHWNWNTQGQTRPAESVPRNSATDGAALCLASASGVGYSKRECISSSLA
jgi:hypothetical protein